MKSIKKRAIVEFVVAELKISPLKTGPAFQKACENYVRLELKIGEKTVLNTKLKSFCAYVKSLYRKFSK